MTQKGYSPPKGFNLDKAFIQSLSLAVNKGKKKMNGRRVYSHQMSKIIVVLGVFNPL